MKNCYDIGRPRPERGWLVICLVIGKYVVVNDFARLAWVIGSTQDEADQKFPNQHNPVQCFELGREMRVGIDYAIAKIEPMEDQ